MIRSYEFGEFCSLQRTYEWYKDGNSLLHEDENAVWEYLRTVSGPETPLHEEQLPTWSKARDSNRNRCFAVSIEDDSVLVTYKVVNLMKSRFVHVVNIPISLNGTRKNVESMIAELRKDRFVRFLHYGCFRDYYGKSERAETYDNYYIDLDEFRSEAMGNHGWMKRHHVLAFEKNPALFRLRQSDHGLDADGMENALQARRSWREEKMLSKKANGSDMTLGGNPKRDTLERAFASLAMDGNGNVVTTLLECDGKAFAVEVSLALNGYAESFFAVHAGRRAEENLERRRVFHDSISILRYFQCRRMVELGLRRFYILGSGGEPNLSKYKMQVCDGRRMMCYIDKNK